MEYIETAQDVERRLKTATTQLQAFEDNVSDEQAWARLRSEHPSHPVIMARVVFLLLAAVSLAAALTVFVLPFIEGFLDPPTRRQLPLELIAAVEAAVGFPLPMVLGVSAIALGVAWFTAGMAAVAIGRDCPMMAWEATEHQKLAEEVKKLTQQKVMIERMAGTPIGAKTRLRTPTPSSRISGAPVSDDALVSFGDPGGGASGGGFGNPTPPLGAASPSMRPTPSFGAPSPTLARASGASAAPSAIDPLVDFGGDVGASSSPSYVIGVETAAPGVSATPRPAGGFERFSTRIPQWKPVGDDWMIDVLRRVEALAPQFPIQARLEFSTERALPFTLVLERATPAMAVRAMMSFVEFLGQIPTPPRARVELRSVSHLDRSFHRNVISALEPFFADAFEVVRKEGHIDIEFAKPDARWSRYPNLPM